ncbi:MAG: DUF2065 family protein [Halocynthiibacter sp.]
MATILLGFGLVLVLEGLFIALVPFRIEDVLKALADILPETRRWLGLGAAVLGGILIYLSKFV